MSHRFTAASVFVAITAVVGLSYLEHARINEELERADATSKERLAREATLYQEAVALERRQEFAPAYQRYNWLCDGVMYKPGPGLEHPCAATTRLAERFHASYSEVMAALNAYRSQHGEYPATLAPVLGELTPSNREMAQKFHYCKRENLTDRVGRCTDGSFTSAAEVSIGTGQYGSHAFTLHR